MKNKYDELAGEVERLEKDEKRLDWINDKEPEVECKVAFNIYTNGGTFLGTGYNIREAIDQAITTHLTDKV